MKSPSEMLAGPPNVQQDNSSPATIITPSSLTSSIVSVAPLVKAPLTISTEMLLPQIPAMVSPASLSSPEKEMAGGLVIQEEDTNDENTTPQAISTDRYYLKKRLLCSTYSSLKLYIKLREGGNNVLFITLVPKVL